MLDDVGVGGVELRERAVTAEATVGDRDAADDEVLVPFGVDELVAAEPLALHVGVGEGGPCLGDGDGVVALEGERGTIQSLAPTSASAASW